MDEKPTKSTASGEVADRARLKPIKIPMILGLCASAAAIFVILSPAICERHPLFGANGHTHS